jgi:hypothetical protein
MKKPGTHQVALALICLVGVFVALQNTRGLEGTEFSGGWLTGPLLSMADVGTALFLLALVVTFVFPRVAAAIGLASSLLCLPLYLYLTAPVQFNQIFGFGHELKVHPSAGFHWNRWAIAGVLTLAVTTYICLRGFAAASREQTPERR